MTTRAIAAIPAPIDKSTEHVEEIINSFAAIDKPGIGFNGFANASGFYAIDQPPRFAGGILGTPMPANSISLGAIVRIGLPALPNLLAHLDDRRETKVTIKHDMGIGAMSFDNEMDVTSYDKVPNPNGTQLPDEHLNDNSGDLLTTYTLTVGDICFVAVGQIVNRSYSAVTNSPTAMIALNSPTHTPALARAVRAEWAGLTPARHRASLILDAYNLDDPIKSADAVQRLCYYYPGTGDSIALALLRRPFYGDTLTDEFVWTLANFWGYGDRP